MKLIVIAILFVTACTSEPAEYAADDGDGETWDEPSDTVGVPAPPAGPNCICDNCTVANTNTKLCGAPFRNGICNMVNPNSNSTDWRWIVQQGNYQNCAALNGVQMTGYTYYGTGNNKCNLSNCVPYP